MAMRISRIAELDGVKHENFKFAVEENTLKVTNSRERIEFNIEFTEERKLKTIKTIEKYTDLKVELTDLTDREILAFVEDKGFNKVMWNPIGKAMHKYNMVEPGDRIAVGVSGGAKPTDLRTHLADTVAAARRHERHPGPSQPAVHALSCDLAHDGHARAVRTVPR